jgi:hypothetical protein
MIITKTRSALVVAAASLSLAALAGPAVAATHKDGTSGAVKSYNWDIPAGTASPSA